MRINKEIDVQAWVDKLIEAEKQERYDRESYHMNVDEILCDLLDTLDLHDVVRAYRKGDKWYA